MSLLFFVIAIRLQFSRCPFYADHVNYNQMAMIEHRGPILYRATQLQSFASDS